MTQSSSSGPTVVLVHAAWADGSSWNNVTEALQSRGLHVIAAPIPMTSLSDDVRAIDRILERTGGPVLLGAHAYSGAVVSATTSAKVSGLVFIASLTPDEGETVADVFTRTPPHPLAPKLSPDGQGFIWLPEASFSTAFAQNAPPQQASLLAATQRPISVACIQEKAPAPLWKKRPAWYLVARQDRMIPEETQRFLATRMGARTRIEPVDHVPMVTAPEIVVDIFSMALDATARTSTM
jgi:pimeloyl-ACP methyl ester carboxylesterase